MGATAADTKREIEEIRKDVLSAAGELRRRVVRAVSPGTYVELARDNPAAVLGLGLGAVSLAGFSVARSIAESRRQNRPSERLKRTVRGAAENLTETAQRAWEAVPSMPISVQLGTPDAKGAENQNTTLQQVMGKEPSMLKRILWAGLVAAMMAAGGLAARRLSATIWRSTMGEAPPTKNV